MTTILRRCAALAMILFFAAVALMSVAFGVTLDGKAAPGIQCTKSAPRPEVGGPYLESTVTTGERTWFPLGVDCTYDSPDDEVGPQTVSNANWPATITWLASSGLAIYGVALLVKPARLTAA